MDNVGREQATSQDHSNRNSYDTLRSERLTGPVMFWHLGASAQSRWYHPAGQIDRVFPYAHLIARGMKFRVMHWTMMERLQKMGCYPPMSSSAIAEARARGVVIIAG